jgi:AraC-like DNA-binding protein
MQDIRNLITDGLSYNDIMQRLKLSERTFYRYLNATFEDDRRLLAENISDEEMLNQMTICRDRLLKQRRDILEQIVNDSDADDKARIAAHHLAAEIAAAVLRLYTEGPAILASRHKFPGTSLTAGGTTGVRLVLKKKEGLKEEEEEEYDELDEEEEEDRKREDYNNKSIVGSNRINSHR